MNNTVYKIDINLNNTDGKKSPISRKSEMTEKERQEILQRNTRNFLEKKKLEERKSIIDGATTAVMVTKIAYDISNQVREYNNSAKLTNLSIGGDLLSMRNTQMQINRTNLLIGRIATVAGSTITGALIGAKTANPYGVVGGAVAGFAVGSWNVAKDIIKENYSIQANERAYNANRQMNSYINNLERERLVKNTGYYR